MIRMILPLMLLAAPALGGTPEDPRGLIPPPRAACGEVPATALSLAALVDIALCRNPQTAAGWAAARAAAAQAGAARGAVLPSIDASFGPTLTRSNSFQGTGFVDGNGQIVGGAQAVTNTNTSARLALSYLIFDGGGRSARIAAADAQAAAALAQYADTAQAVVLNVVTAYNALAGNRAVEEANRANVAFARQSRDLAAARSRAGVATGADRLQAETQLAQAELTLIQTRGSVATSAAQLAVAVGLPPTMALDLAPAAPLGDAARLKAGAAALIAEAERLRPDILSARANVSAAEANVRSARSAGRPSLAVQASNSLSAVDTNVDRNLASVGVILSVPIFSGWNTRYNIAAARAQLEQQQALAEQTRQQAGLAVYSNVIAFENALASLETARVLVASATESAALAQGRYKAGVGTFAELLNAQAAQAGARQQLVQAEFNLRTADAQLARAVGDMGEAIPERRR